MVTILREQWCAQCSFGIQYRNLDFGVDLVLLFAIHFIPIRHVCMYVCMYCIGTNLLYGGLQYLYIHTCGTHLRSTACNSCVPPKEFRSVLYSSRRDGHYGDATESRTDRPSCPATLKHSRKAATELMLSKRVATSGRKLLHLPYNAIHCSL